MGFRREKDRFYQSFRRPSGWGSDWPSPSELPEQPHPRAGAGCPLCRCAARAGRGAGAIGRGLGPGAASRSDSGTPKLRRTLALTVGAPGAIPPAVLRRRRRHPLSFSAAATRCPPRPALCASMTGSLFKANFWVSERGAGRAGPERTRERALAARLHRASPLPGRAAPGARTPPNTWALTSPLVLTLEN